MKKLKYRSVLSTLCVAMLSVFLFTSCEKESESTSNTNLAKERLEKFKRLSFTALNSSNSSGEYVGTNGNVTYVRTGSGGSTFTQTNGSSNSFTDPSSTGYSFSVSSSFGEGGGSATLDGKDYNMNFAFCASADFIGLLESDDTLQGDEESDVNLDLFVGISGDFDISGVDSEDTPGLDLVLYAFSYNGSTEIGGFDDFGEEELDDIAFVIAVTANEDEEEASFYFATEGTVNFSGSEVILNGVKMAKIDFFSDDPEFDNEVDLEAQLECVSFDAE